MGKISEKTGRLILKINALPADKKATFSTEEIYLMRTTVNQLRNERLSKGQYTDAAECIHDFQSLRAPFDAQNALQADHATGPHSRHYIVCVSAVFCPTPAKCRP